MSNTHEKQIVSGTDYQASEYVKYSKPKVNPQGGKNVGILNSETNGATYLSTPLMLTWGVNENDFDIKGNFTYDMYLQFPIEEYATDFSLSYFAFEDSFLGG